MYIVSWVWNELYLLTCIHEATVTRKNDNEFASILQEATPTDLARSRKLAKQLWEASEVDVKLQNEEKHY